VRGATGGDGGCGCSTSISSASERGREGLTAPGNHAKQGALGIGRLMTNGSLVEELAANELTLHWALTNGSLVSVAPRRLSRGSAYGASGRVVGSVFLCVCWGGWWGGCGGCGVGGGGSGGGSEAGSKKRLEDYSVRDYSDRALAV